LREEPADGGEESPVGGRIAGPLPSLGEDLQLTAKHGDLQFPIVDPRAGEEAKQAAQEPIQEEREHGPSLYWVPSLATMPHVSGPIEFVYPARSAAVRQPAGSSAESNLTADSSRPRRLPLLRW
jgi:hypothetical protein